MLYFLHEWLDVNLFQYITFRAGVGFFLAFVLASFFMPKFIRWSKSKKASQPISEYAPESHKAKSETPTMGGLVFIGATLVSSLLTARIDNLYVIGGILIIGFFALIGAKDDYAKIKANSNAGLSAKAKFFYQSLVAFFISILILFAGMDTDFYIPFYKHSLFTMELFAILFWMLVMVAASNAVNITDGLDGLATVPSIFALSSLSVLAYITGNAILSNYLLLPKAIGVGEVAIIGAAFAGSLIGFLWYNCHPAEIFMGDSGSLSMGAFVGYLAILSKSEVLLILIGFIFVLETFSVILQIGSYKTRGKRIFLMAPIHHHYEVKGWAENKIIVRFWIIALISNIIALISIKIR